MKRQELVYVADFGDGRVKIGCTRRPKGRLSELYEACPAEVIQMYITPRMSCAYSVEQLTIEWMGYKFKRWQGREWFFAPVLDAIATVNKAAIAHRWAGNTLHKLNLPAIVLP